YDICGLRPRPENRRLSGIKTSRPWGSSKVSKVNCCGGKMSSSQKGYDFLEQATALHQQYMSVRSPDCLPALREAAKLYQLAIRSFSDNGETEDYAAAQSNLGLLYLQLSDSDPSNLASAIECYQAALLVYTQQEFPVDWARTQHNLALAFEGLPSQDRSATLQKAIKCYEAALIVRTEQNDPLAWAGTQRNLGDVYRKLQLYVSASPLERAITCY